MVKIIKDIMSSVGGTVMVVTLSVISICVAIRLILQMSTGDLSSNNYKFILILLLLIITFLMGRLISGGGKRDREYEKNDSSYATEYGIGSQSTVLKLSNEEVQEIEEEKENTCLDSLTFKKGLYDKFDEIQDGEVSELEDEDEELSEFAFELGLKNKLDKD